jgi:mitochondrial splicing suppressor protein 51
MAATSLGSGAAAASYADATSSERATVKTEEIRSMSPNPLTSAGMARVDSTNASPSLGHRRGRSTIHSDYLSDKATTALIRRVLCAQHIAERGRSSTPAPIEELLQPLTSRNDVDLQLYALISIILREYVQNWYNKITPDETFVDEILQIIAHCTRALEQRLRKVDLESLLLDELPELFDTHVRGLSNQPTPLIERAPAQSCEHVQNGVDCLTCLRHAMFMS